MSTIKMYKRSVSFYKLNKEYRDMYVDVYLYFVKRFKDVEESKQINGGNFTVLPKWIRFITSNDKLIFLYHRDKKYTSFNDSIFVVNNTTIPFTAFESILNIFLNEKYKLESTHTFLI